MCETRQGQFVKKLEEDLKTFYDYNKLGPKELHTFQGKLIGNKVTELVLKPELYEDKMGSVTYKWNYYSTCLSYLNEYEQVFKN